MYLTLTTVFGFLAVALGAFGAHALDGVLTAYQQDIWQKAVNYQMFHTVALGLVCVLMARSQSKSLLFAARFFSAGTILFSGSLYILALTGISKLGMVTPFGGVAFLAGWAMLFAYSFKHQTAQNQQG
ncbi:DUF423 domain-containing protein [Parendozoicomonas haliclonae]|uniref:DUF423 domain-containing protein n=1 Tax=Parendozoicomonas haliclonae TaxID=1960125 RepID=A0A1X7AIU8_9GAMM|nr:DUF423 domain-containing protein [Parendozoicomonas haliclonae]SMA45834.1 hypothetical protein EHSB41UT_02004 [Parendozoicomonas haliclonae]